MTTTSSKSEMTSPFRAGSIEFSREAVLRDFRIGWRSRQMSVLGRREVLSGKAKFGIFGAGKEVAQLAMAYAFEKGDYRAGYYRDQTFMMALGLVSLEQLFAQLYAHADHEHEPFFGGRSMNGHFATRLLDDNGNWIEPVERYNSAADLSPTAGQMPKLVGLSYASVLYREVEGLCEAVPGFSEQGREIAFGTIGNASCAEGLFWEAINAVGVLQAPLLMSIWDDGYGISVPNRFQMTKGDVSAVLSGFRRRLGGRPGIDIFTVPGWDYPQLCEAYLRASQGMRRDHVPVLMHVTEVTQPQGHSTSGSHERYKSPERLEWEQEFDCLRKMREWILSEGLARDEELDEIIEEEEAEVVAARDRARRSYLSPMGSEAEAFLAVARPLVETMSTNGGEERSVELEKSLKKLERRQFPLRRDVLAACHEILVAARRHGDSEKRAALQQFRLRLIEENRQRYGSHLYSESYASSLWQPEILPVYREGAVHKNGFEILNACFDEAFARTPHLFAMGEDVGALGDVNQGFAHLQEKYGELRITDTGIREATILGQAIGMALRGLRPIAEIQYLDYILYALQVMSDDLASLHWRTRGGQKAPVIIRTRGHRLEGIWHSGSPMAGVIHLCRGLVVCVPRNATQAAGFYNTLLDSDDAALVVEVLNGYRKKELMPENISELKTPLGLPEVIREGSDVTVVTYGACCEIVLEAVSQLAEVGIDCEVIDVRTLLPFDREAMIAESVEKTSRLVVVDEDVPGGTSGFILQQVLEEQGAYQWLDSPPLTLAAQEHRPAYGSDGDYFSKPSREDVFEGIYQLLRESEPEKYPPIW